MDIQNNETIRDAIRGFDGVWNRVTKQETSAPASSDCNTGDRTLRRLIREERQAAHDDMCLARRLRGMARMNLAALSSEASQRARALSAEYFIATGDCVKNDTEDAENGGCLCALRSAFERSCRLTEMYESAAEREDDCTLREMYARFAAEHCNAARMLRTMITNSF